MPRKTKSPRMTRALAEAKTENLMNDLDAKVRPLQDTIHRAVEQHLAFLRSHYHDAAAPDQPACAPADFGRLMVDGLIRHEFLRRAVTEHGKELDGINDLLAKAGVRPKRRGRR